MSDTTNNPIPAFTGPCPTPPAPLLHTKRSKPRTARPAPAKRTPRQHYLFTVLSRINVLLTALNHQHPLPARIPLADLGPGCFIHATERQAEYVYSTLLSPSVLSNVEKQAIHEQDANLVADFLKCIPYEIIVDLFASNDTLKRQPRLAPLLLTLYPCLRFFEDTLPASSPDATETPIVSVSYFVDHVCDY